MSSHKLYFKITNEKENHNGFQYNDGLNVLKEKFNDDPTASCVAGGFYFTNSENIFEFLDHGIYLREITLPTDDPDFKMVQDKNNKWRANKIILGKKYNLNNISTFEFLISNGANIHADSDYAIRWASINGHSEVIQFLISNGADIHANNDFAIRWASIKGHLEVVQHLISKGADIHTDNDYAIRWASKNGHLEIVKFLVSSGANIYANDNCAIKWASGNGHSEVVQFLISKGADIHADNDFAIRWASIIESMCE